MQTGTREVTRRRFTVHEYHRMAEAGILHEDDRIELIDGDLVEMAAIGTQAGIPEVWIVDLEGEKIEHHTAPSGDLYRHVELNRRGEKIESAALSGMDVRVDDVLG